MTDQARPVRIRSRRTFSKGWIKLEKVTFEQTREDGSNQAVSREVYHNGPGAAVLPVDRARGTILVVRQLRIPALIDGDDPFLIELCAGLVDEGDEPAHMCGRYSSPGASAEELHLFLAGLGAHVGRSGGLRKEGEEIEFLELPVSRAWEMVDAGQIGDAKTVLLLEQLRRRKE